MANKNITQLTPQTGSADPTSLFYTVTGSGTFFDKSLPLSVLFNSPTITGAPNIAGYLSTAAAIATYAPLISPGFTGTVTITNSAVSGQTLSVIANSNTANGAAIFFSGDGGTTPNKTLRVTGGNMQVVNSAGAATILTLSDAGNLVVNSINTTPIGNTTPAAGSFTTLTASTPIAITSGGTGSGTQTGALSNILGASAIPIANGGTNATTATNARTNLGLGTAATQNTGTSGANVPLLNGTNTWSSAQSFSGNIVPTSTVGIQGTTTNDNPAAGNWGEFISAQATGVSLTTATTANITSISLTAGDWDVRGNVEFDAAAGTTFTLGISGTNTVSATAPLAPSRAVNVYNTGTGSAQSQTVPTTRLSLASTTTVFLVAQATFSGSTLTASGFIAARRVR